MLVRYLLSETTQQENESIEHWLKSSAEHQQRFNQLVTVWERSRTPPSKVNYSEDIAWRRFQKRISSEKELKQPNRLWMRIAAIALIVLGAALVYRFVFPPNATLMAKADQQALIDTLADGSEVTLNRHSTLSYPARFTGNERRVRLKGEGFFKITPNKDKPFIIEVDEVLVRVVGTSFNVREHAGEVEVVVETGMVEVSLNGEKILLRPNERTILHSQDTVLTRQTSAERLHKYYRTRDFVCDRTPLWKLVAALNEAYDAQIVIENPQLRNLEITTTFSDLPLAKILEIIEQTLSIRAVEEGNLIKLK